MRKSKTTLIEVILHCILNNKVTCLKEIHNKKNRKGTVLGFFLGLWQSSTAVKGSGLGRGNLSNDKETAFYFCKLGWSSILGGLTLCSPLRTTWDYLREESLPLQILNSSDQWETFRSPDSMLMRIKSRPTVTHPKLRALHLAWIWV